VTFFEKAYHEQARREIANANFTITKREWSEPELRYATPYQHPKWKQIRLAVLERDHWTCLIRGPKCLKRASDADHIISWRAGGSRLDPANLRAACAPCNNGRVEHGVNTRWMFKQDTKIILIVGPPIPNHLYDYVQSHQRREDVIIDWQTIVNELNISDEPDQVDLDQINQVRNGRLTNLRQGKIKAPRVLITSSNPDALILFPYHDLIVHDPGETKAIEMMGDGSPKEISRVREWYANQKGMTTKDANDSSRSW
jgi:hypothetical protein